MPKIISKARQARLAYQARIGRPVSIQEVADAVGVDRKRLTQIELGRMERIDTDTLAKLCAFYGVSSLVEILEYDPNMQEAGYAAGSLIPA